MAAVDFSIGTPFASALQGIVQPKLAEYGWTTGDPEDSTIFEYILLMLGNNKNETQIASELSNDLLDLGPENPETQQFAHWLFEQIYSMQRQHNGEAVLPTAEASQASGNQAEGAFSGVMINTQDADMDGASEPGVDNMYVPLPLPLPLPVHGQFHQSRASRLAVRVPMNKPAMSTRNLSATKC
jgi:hypothetical protein